MCTIFHTCRIPEVIDAAKHCQQILHRTEQNGLRENTPSKFEVCLCTVVMLVVCILYVETRVPKQRILTS